ncbi:MAG TPA: secondary thiamine-phosphate synthase enzyme YjbQ [Bryobacteraceae bacterium]|jgi:secondary thiamine-phosphate synthase enzyme|nr:secondary thiamine-phosphate synthase enzyme YjbQ [Bryobacteraceae bacterium]
MTRQSTTQFEIRTAGKGLYDFTRQVEAWIERLRTGSGLLTLFCRHTSASLVIQENADPDVTADLKDFFERLVPEDARLYRHTAEGPDDMTSHIRTALTQTSLAIPVHAGRLTLGTWQGIYLFEHRQIPHRRGVAAHLLYESLHGPE